MTFPCGAMRHGLRALSLACLLSLAACGGESADALRESGKAYLAKKNAVSAVIQFKASLQKEPRSPQTRLLLGRALLEAGDPGGAVVELSKVMDERHAESETLPVLARALLLANEPKRLTTLYGNVTLADANAQASLRTSLSTAWAGLGEKERARQALHAATQAVPDFVPALIMQARLTAAAGQPDQALSQVEAALARDPASAEGWQLKGDILAGVRNEPAAAVEAYRRALGVDPAFAAAHVALISEALKAGDAAQARAQADRLRAAMPKHPQTLYVDARLALYDRDVKTARERTQQLLRMAPEHVGVLQLAGAVESQAGWPLAAEAHYLKALSLDPQLPLARRNLAQVYLRLGQPQKTLQVIEPLTRPDSVDAEALSLAGEARLQAGDPRGAEALYQRAAKISPNDSRVRTALALMNLERGDPATAFGQLEGLAAQTRDTAADMALVSARLKRGEYDQAMRALDTMERKQPKSATVYEMRGLVYAERRDHDAARAALEQALVLEPSRYSAIAKLAALDLRQGRTVDARKRVEAVIAAEPRNFAARMTLAGLRAGEGASLPELREILAGGIKAAPTEPGPRLQLIELLQNKRQFKDALIAAQEAAATLPADSAVLDALGRAQQAAGETNQAISTFRKLVNADPKSTLPHLRLGDLFKAAGDREAAVASLRRALEIEPGLDSAQVRLIDILLADGHGKEALAQAESMQMRAPAAASGYLLEAAIHLRLKSTPNALKSLQTGLDRATDKSELAAAMFRTLRKNGADGDGDRFAERWLKDHRADAAFTNAVANDAILRRQLPRAEGLLQAVIAARPGDAMALNNLAWVMTTLGKPGAVGYAQRAVELRPGQPTLMDTLAMALAAEKQLPEALALQKRALELAPDNGQLRMNLARIALQAGDKTLARTELDRLSAEGPKQPYQEEAARLRKTI